MKLKLEPPSIFHDEKLDDLNKFGVYMINFIDDPNSCYVGSTKISGKGKSGGFRSRWTLHLNFLNKDRHTKKMKEAFMRYGINSIRFKILEIVSDVSIIIEREQYWIDKLGSCVSGYNNKPFAGSSKSLVSIIDNYGKGVTQYDTEGRILNKFISARQAARALCISPKVIHKCCTGKNVLYKGYIWRFSNDCFDKFNTKPKIDVKIKSVAQYDVNGLEVGRFNTISEASKKTGITLSNISMCVSGSRNKAGGYFWRNVAPNL